MTYRNRCAGTKGRKVGKRKVNLGNRTRPMWIMVLGTYKYEHWTFNEWAKKFGRELREREKFCKFEVEGTDKLCEDEPDLYCSEKCRAQKQRFDENKT